jgi:hypothetical protein
MLNPKNYLKKKKNCDMSRFLVKYSPWTSLQSISKIKRKFGGENEHADSH